MIKGEVIGGEGQVARLNALPPQIHAGLKVGIGRGCLMVMTRTKEQKLSGQVLNVRTGRLRRSVTRRIEESAQDVVGIVGTKVEYAGKHEYGFHGTETVREHLRKAKDGSEFSVRAHTRRVDYNERSFLRSSLAELRPEIRQEVQQAINIKLKVFK